MKFLRFLSLAAALILAIYSAFPVTISPFMRTVIFALSIAFLLLFALLNTITRSWDRMVGMVCIILLACLALVPSAVFQSMTLTGIFGVEELAPVECVYIKPLVTTEASHTVVWTPSSTNITSITSQEDKVTDDLIRISGGSMDIPREYAENMSVRNYWMGEPREFPFSSIGIRFTDGHQIDLVNTREDYWQVTWTFNEAEPELLDGQWCTSAPITDLLDPQVLEYIHSLFAAT